MIDILGGILNMLPSVYTVVLNIVDSNGNLNKNDQIVQCKNNIAW